MIGLYVKEIKSYIWNITSRMNKETFEKGRIINFSDAVFSIALTLLVLEITIPGLNEVETYGTLGTLKRLIPSFIGFFVSFLVTSLYWIAHLRLMKFVKEFENSLLWMNIWLLLFVVLLPFSTAFYVKDFLFNGPFVFYSLNLFFIGFFNVLMILNVIKKNKNMGERTIANLNLLKWKAVTAMLVWLLAGLLSFVIPFIAKFIFMLIFFVDYFLKRNYNKKLSTLA